MLEQHLVQRGNHRHHPLGCVGLHARDSDLAAREVDVGTVELAQLGDPDAGESERRDQREPGDIVAAALGPGGPNLAPADLANEGVRHLVLTREAGGRCR